MRTIRMWLVVAGAGLLASFPATSQVALSGVQGLAAGDSHACLWSPLGLARCWGHNGSEGLLGIGVASPPESLSEPQRITAAGDVVQVSAGVVHTCALRRDGSVACWGNNDSLQLGGATADTLSTTPLPVPGLANVLSLAAGDFHTCALISGGTVRCWGYGELGQLGNGTTSSATPLQVTGISTAAQVAAGGNFSCARLASGAISCWGQNDRGQLGRASSGMGDSSATAAEVAGLGGAASDFDLGSSHACALVAGVVRCWGGNVQGLLGDGGGSARHTPGDVIDITGGSPVPLAATAISAGSRHSCAVRPSGALACWGSGSDGRLGNGGSADAPNPVAVSGFDGSSLAAVAVSVGGSFTCARTAQGEARCWGVNTSRQLGDGSTTDSGTPVTVLAPQELVSLSASATSAIVGTALTFTLVVNLAEFSLIDLPVARVTFYAGNTPISGCSDLSLTGSPPSVSCTTASLSAGVHDVSALYSGGAFSSETLAGPRRISITAAAPTLRVHTFDFATVPPSFGAALTSIFEDTRPFEPFLVAPSPITTHLLIADNMPVAFEQLTFTAASSNSALLDTNSFRFANGTYGGQAYKAVAIRPKADANGSATITYSVLGPGNAVLATTTTALTVTPVNDPPATFLTARSAVDLDPIGALSVVNLPATATAGSQHTAELTFWLQESPIDEVGQTLSPTVALAAASDNSPVSGIPTLQGVTLANETNIPELAASRLTASFLTTASGLDGWARFDARLQDNGTGTCLSSAEGPTLVVAAIAAFIDSMIAAFGGSPNLLDTTLAMTRPGVVLGADGIQLAPLANTCSRKSRFYVTRGDWAILSAHAESASHIERQLEELQKPGFHGAGKAVTGERYVVGFQNSGTIPLTGARVRIGQPAGVSAMTWTCRRGGNDCATPSGTGPVDMSVDLGVNESVNFGVNVTFSGSTGFVSLRAEAAYPPGVRGIVDDGQSISVVVATSSDGVFYGGFER